MATLIKRGGRKLLAVGNPYVTHYNLAMVGLLTNRHVSVELGDYIIRLSPSDIRTILLMIKNTPEGMPVIDLKGEVI